MRSITDFLNSDVAGDAELQDAIAGKSSAGGFDGPPLAVTRQYRATIVRGEWRQANSGKYNFSFTFEITEDPENEFVGRKFSETYSIDKDAHKVSKEKFARLLGESGIQASDFTGDNEKDAKLFEGTEYVIATRVWGEEGDRTGLRYLNRDRGQQLLTNIPAPKSQGGTKAPLTADISVNKEKGPQENVAEEPAQPATPVSLPGAGRSSGVNLPPGLAK